jgi:hypothetical protein
MQCPPPFASKRLEVVSDEAAQTRRKCGSDLRGHGSVHVFLLLQAGTVVRHIQSDALSSNWPTRVHVQNKESRGCAIKVRWEFLQQSRYKVKLIERWFQM